MAGCDKYRSASQNWISVLTSPFCHHQVGKPRDATSRLDADLRSELGWFSAVGKLLHMDVPGSYRRLVATARPWKIWGPFARRSPVLESWHIAQTAIPVTHTVRSPARL